MAFSDSYRRQAVFLVRLLPVIAAEDCFALKGGTAINLFVRDMPRLSVDIDLAYIPVAPRAQSLEHISDALERIAGRLEGAPYGAHVTRQSPAKGVPGTTRLTARADGAQVKVEVTPVLRGCVYEPELVTVAPTVEDEFGFAQTHVLSFADLYAGKIVAALDRQHPRDLFDVRDLLANEGIGDQVRRAIVERGQPDWDLLGVEHVDRLPAVQWKQQNLNSLDASMRTHLVSSLEAVLGQRH